MNYELLTKNTMRIFNEIIAKEEENLMNKKIKEHLKKLGLRKNQKIDGYFIGVDFLKVKTSYKNCSNLVTIKISSGHIIDVRSLGREVR